MIQVSDGKIGARETFAIVYMLLAINVTDTTPDLLLSVGINAAWMIPLLSASFLLGPLLLLLPLFSKYDTGLVEITFQLTGNFFGKLITIGMALIVLASIAINSRNYADIVKVMYYPNTSISVILISLMLVGVYYLAYLGINVAGRTSWLVVPTIIVLSSTLIITVMNKLDYQFIFPIAGPGFKVLFSESFKHIALLGDIIVIGAMFSYVRSYQSFRKGILWGFGVSILKMTVYLLIFIMIFDYSAVKNIAFPYHQLARMATIGTLANHVEAIFLAAWFIGASIHFAIYLYVAAYLLGKVFKMKSYKRLLIWLAGLTTLAGLMIENFFQGVQARNMLIMSSSALFLILPIVLRGLDFVKGRSHK